MDTRVRGLLQLVLAAPEYQLKLGRRAAMAHSRRQFLRGALRFGAVSSVAPSLMMDARLAERVLAAGARDTTGRILVVVQLAGGNDGLNMIIPYGDGRYYQDRPTLAIPEKQVLHIDNRLGFHPSLTGLKALYDRGEVAVVQGVGYPEPNLSHFRSTDIWQSALPVGAVDTGWLGRYLDSAMAGLQNPLKALSLGPLLPKAFWASKVQVPAVQDLQSFRFQAGLAADSEAQRLIGAFQRISGARATGEGPYLSLVQLADSDAYQATIRLAGIAHDTPLGRGYPDTDLARQLKLVTQIIATDLGTRVFMVTQSGYDDHADEASAHPRLMAEMGDAVAAFYADMACPGPGRSGAADDLLRVRAAAAGERQPGHRPWHSRPNADRGRRGEGRPVRRDAQPHRSRQRQPEVHHRLPLGLQHGAGQLDGCRSHRRRVGHLPDHPLRVTCRRLANPPLRSNR